MQTKIGVNISTKKKYWRQPSQRRIKSTWHVVYLTRIAYYLIGAIEDLPPPLKPAITKETPIKQRKTRGQAQAKAPQPEEDSSSEVPSEFQLDTEDDVESTPIATRL